MMIKKLIVFFVHNFCLQFQSTLLFICFALLGHLGMVLSSGPVTRFDGGVQKPWSLVLHWAIIWHTEKLVSAWAMGG
jgi:hypothetical protein